MFWAWETQVANHDDLKAWLVEQELTVVKASDLLARRRVALPERTLHPYALEVLGVGRSARGSCHERFAPMEPWEGASPQPKLSLPRCSGHLV